MKKFTILGLSLMVGAAASAQLDIVKDVERTIKGDNVDYAAAKAALQPALTNDETKGLAQTWFVAGQIGFKHYDALYLQKQLGQPVDGKVEGAALISGYENMMKALPLDSVVNEKGKVKTKYSKDIVNDIVGHYNDFYTAGFNCYNAGDYDGAYKVWDIWVNMPKNESLGKKAPQAPADTLVGQIIFNQGIILHEANDFSKSLAKLQEALKLGYTKKVTYDYAISAAVQTPNMEMVAKLSEEAYPVYGKEDPKYLQLMINYRIEKSQYEEAKKMLDEAIAANPDDAQLYNIMGILYEAQKDNDTALKYFRQSIEKDPKMAQGHYNIGRKVSEQAYAINDASGNLSQAEYENVYKTKMVPLFNEAAKHLEEALRLDANIRDAIRYLRNIYYNLKDEENLKRVEAL